MLRQVLDRLRGSRIYRVRVEWAQRRRFASELAESKLFDRDWYGRQNPEVQALGLDPIDHYLRFGSRNGRSPTPLFDNAWYLSQYPDVRPSGLDPFLHYLRYGGLEGRDPSPLFDSDWYLAQNPDVAAAGINPLSHYILHGAAHGLSPNPLFKSRWYVAQHPEAQVAGTNPLAYYLANALTTNPNPWFDGAWYLRTNPEVAKAGTNPLAHYIGEGAAQGRSPSPLFRGRWQLENVPDLLTQSDQSLLDDLAPPGAAAAAPAIDDQAVVDVVAIVSDAERDGLERLMQSLKRSPVVGATKVAFSSQARTAPMLPFAEAIAAAKKTKRHLLVLLCDMELTARHIEDLVGILATDPLIGFAVPRYVSTESGRLLPLLRTNEPGALASYDQSALGDIPASQVAPEFLSACLLMRRDLVRNFSRIPGNFETAVGALRALMAWGRRLGFRTLIDNRIVIPLHDEQSSHPELTTSEQSRLAEFFPDAILADTRFRELSCHYREALLARAQSTGVSERVEILFDCTGMTPLYNGTNEGTLGILDGANRSASRLHVTIYATDEAISFHGLRERYKNFRILGGKLTGTYDVAVRLSQPWTIRTFAELHRHALRIMVLMLDTIAWDVIYAASPEVELTWKTVATHADAIFYISEFTRDRFNFRFPVKPHIHQTVTRLSCHYDEYLSPAQNRSSRKDHVLVIGNDLEHKGLTDALEILPQAFPELQFIVVGQDTTRQRNVTTFRSGQLSEDQIDSFFSTARMLVFPSFYEGFGLPVVKGLAYGLDVVARRSDLLLEIGRNCAPRGRLIPFDDNLSLVRTVANILGERQVEIVPMGTALAAGTEPTRWKDVADRIIERAEVLAAEASLDAHDRREASLFLAHQSDST